jgi:hypothetical protein
MRIGAMAQCAMCRASVENSISSDSESFGASLNTGILYLFVTPYLLVALIAFLWYRGSRKNEKNIKISIHSGRKMS